jgi:hypothetical protein
MLEIFFRGPLISNANTISAVRTAGTSGNTTIITVQKQDLNAFNFPISPSLLVATLINSNIRTQGKNEATALQQLNHSLNRNYINEGNLNEFKEIYLISFICIHCSSTQSCNPLPKLTAK